LKIDSSPFQILDWNLISKEEHRGESGIAYWQVFLMNDIRIRMVEYSPNYTADHWCRKGHIIFCLEGEMDTRLDDGQVFTLKQGMTYHVGDDAEVSAIFPTKDGCKLFIVD
jgi:quercetin dioxygenase-like cupin family protein